MKVKHYFSRLFLFFALCVPWVTQAQTSTITINDGTATNGNIPINGYNLDSPNMHSQMLIPADRLTTISGGALYSVMFYLQTAGDASKNFSNNWTITLIETTATSLSTSYEDVSAGTVVYTGLIDWKTTTPTITFASPYVYNGGNLLIDMHYTNSAGGWNSLNFYGVSSTGLSTMNYGSSDPTTATARSYSPKMTFGYGPAPTCYQPTGVTASNVTANSADFSWTASGHGETQYQYLCIPATDTINWANATLVSTTSATLAGLTPNTSYKFYVRSYCSATDQSYVFSTSFKTLCAAVDPASLGVIGFETSEGFTTGAGNMANCWEGGNMQSTSTSYMPYVQANTSYSTYSRTGSNCLKMQALVSSYTTADSCYAVLPEFTYTGSIASYEAHFYMCKTSTSSYYSYNDTLWVGIVSDPADLSDLEIVGYGVNTTATHAQQIVSFSSYTGGTTGYIVFLAAVDQNASASSKYASFYIDDLEIIKSRATRAPVVDSVFNITTTTVDVAFSGSNATSYRIVAATEPVSNPDTYTTWAIDTVVTASPATINVQASTNYYLYVQGYGTDTSFFSTPVTQFQSGCDVVDSFPWTENFNTQTYGEFAKICWFNEHADGPGTYPAYISTSVLSDNTTPQLYFKDQSATTYTRVSTPEFNIPTAGAYEFNIDVYRSNSSTSTTLEGVQVIVENTNGGYDTTFIPRVYSNTAGVGAVAVADTWYTYTISLPKAGVQRVILLGCNQYGSSVYVDNLRVRKSPTCFKVDSVDVRDNQTTQATIEWQNGTSAKYQVVLTSENINPDTLSTVPASVIAFNDSTASNVDSMLVTGLTPATKYYVYVRGLCAGEQSDWSTGISFRTACQVLTISSTNIYTEGFENIDDNSKEVPCWDINTTSANYPYVYSYSYYAHSGSKYWNFGGNSGTNDTTYMVLPETTNPASALRLRFWLRGYSSTQSSNDSIIVGYMTDETDASTFTRLEAIQPVGSYTLYDYDFGNYTNIPAGARLALVRIPVAFYSSHYGSYIDDVVISLAPTCKKVQNFAASNLTKRSVDLSWTATSATNYEVIVANQSIDPANLDSAALTHIIYNDTTITANNVTVSGLASLTTYYAYVRGNCGAGDYSEWTNELSFQTAMAMNYVDSFTVSMLGSTYVSNYGVDSLLAGSDNLISESSRWTRSTSLSSDSASVKMNVYGSNRSGYYVTPLIDLHDADTASLAFKLCRRDYGNANPVEDLNPDAEMYFHVMVSTDGLQTFTNIDTWRNDAVAGQPVGNHSLYNDIPTYYQVYDYDLSAYLDQSIQIVFAAGQYTSSGDDYDIHLDDITIAGAYDSVAVVANVNDTTMGYVTGAGNFVKNSDVTLTAVANEHYHFVSWSNGATTETMTFFATQDTTFTATFAADSSNIAGLTADSVMGTVSGSGRFPYGYTAELTATANYGYHLTGWSNGDTTATIYVTVASDSTITANFAIDTFTVTLNVNDNAMGTVQGAGSYTYNSQATLTASPAENHHFVSWSNGDTNSTCPITVLGDTTLTATFAIDSRHFLYTVNDPVRGSATSTPDTGYYDNGTSITLTADSADVHCHFRGWRDLAGTYVSFDNPFTFTLTSDTIVEAEFYVDSLSVTLSVNNDTLGRIVSGAGRYAYNALDTVVAEALTPHARFLGWYQGDNRRSSSLSAKFQMVMDLSLEARFGWDSHEILAASADTVMGTTTGSGTYKHGTTATLTAVPADHYHFVEWSNGDTTETINVFVESDSSFTATFDSNFYGVTLVAAGDNHGTLTGAGSYKYLSEVTVEAIPADHGVFTQWSNGITANPYTFTLEGDTTITAIFAWDEHAVTAAVNDAAMGTTTGTGTYTHGTTATLTATAAEHYHFTGWSNGETTESIEVYVVDDTTLTANFAIDTHSVTLYCDYHVGQVTINGGSSTGRFTYGTEVTIAAVADTQQVFSTWSDGDTHQVRTLTVTGDTTLEAYFNLVVYDVTASVNDTTMGYVTGTGRYAYGTMATLRGIAKPHYHFVSWSDGIDVYLHSFMVYGPMHLTATFALDQHEATALVNNTDLGTTTGSGRYDYGTTVTLSATPAAHAVFTGWSNGETANPYTFTLEADTTVTALFIRDQHTVTAATADPAMGTATGTGVYTHGDMATLTAIPATHYHFTQWSTGDTVNPVSLLVEQDETLTAYFAVNQYEVTATVNDPAMGTVAGAGRYDYGTRVTLTALPAANASFVSWSNGATTPSVTITLKGDTTLTATFEMGDHILTATSSDETMGSAEGSGTYRQGTTVLLTATAAAHHHFVKWSNGTTANPATLLLTSDSTVEAIFAIDQHQLAATSADEAMGTVTGAGTYDYGTPVTLTAMPAAHATFTGWSDGTTANPYTFALESDTSLTATFAWDEYTVRVASNDTLMGTATGSGVYTYGTTATLTATAAEHCHFVKWSNHATTATITVTVESDSMLTAIFAADQYTVAAGVNNTLLGTVAGAGTYDYGTTVTLTATPTAHATFTGWSDGTTANPYTFTLTENTALTANFAWDSHTIAATSNNATMGTVTGAGTYTHGTVATLTATANAHYHLVGWSNGATANVINIYVDQDSTLTATFATDQYTVMAQANNMTLGTVTGAGTYDYNATVTLTALPAAHARFSGWSDGSTANPYTFTLTGNTTLTANFALDSHTVTASVNDATMGTVTGAGSYLHGTMATLTATPAAHYHFVNWSNGSTSSVIGIYMDKDTAVTATFAVDQYAVTTQVNVMDLGTVTGAGTYNYGDTVTLTASPADHAVFQNWSDGSTVNPYTFVLTSDMTFTAYFGMDSHEIVANVNDTLRGTVTGAGTYTHGTMATLTAVANEHYHFDHWSNGATTSTISIFVEDDSTVTAYFSVDMHRVVVNLNDDDMGYVSGTGVYCYGDTVTLTANANPHYDFAGWSNGDTNPVLTFVVDGDITLQANFVAEVYTVTAQADNDTMGTVTGSGSYSYGDMVVLIATANAGYHFVSWSDGDTNAVRTFEAEMDVTLTAHFEATVGIREAEAASFIVAGESMRVVVKAAEGEQVWVYDVNGRMLHHTQRAAELETYAVPASGLYLVKVGNYPARRVVVLR